MAPSQARSRTSSFAYGMATRTATKDSQGNVVSVVDAANKTTSYAYDAYDAYDPNDNQIAGLNRSISYTSYNRPSTITAAVPGGHHPLL
jgi:RHS Repeat